MKYLINKKNRCYFNRYLKALHGGCYFWKDTESTFQAKRKAAQALRFRVVKQGGHCGHTEETVWEELKLRSKLNSSHSKKEATKDLLRWKLVRQEMA